MFEKSAESARYGAETPHAIEGPTPRGCFGALFVEDHPDDAMRGRRSPRD
jgi:hypothetical protein